MNHRCLKLAVLLLLGVVSAWCVRQQGNTQEKKPAGLSGDFSKELPRLPASTPEESRQKMQLHADFRVELVASEPLVHDPVAIAFDAFGKIYVVQLPGYNAYAQEDTIQGGSVALLEDRDKDGRYETSTLFAENLKYPTAVCCWDGGVFVGDAPDLLYLKDQDGDGKADERKVVFRGFGSDKAGEAHLNSFRWGLDNRLHISTNLAGGDVQVGSGEKEKTVSVRGRGFMFDPRNLGRFELTSGGGQHGMSMDDWGRKFVCQNSVPAQTLMYDDRYAARNPQLKAVAPAVSIAPDGKYTKLYRVSPPEPWRVLRTRLRKEGKFRGSDEGGKPFGFFTGATGITIFRGDAWPEKYHGNMIVGDVANNLVYRANLEQQGLGLVARRADENAEVLASTDIWFRPVQFANAPDGNLYMLDMCRELIEGAAFLPPEFFKYLDAASGNDRGRIYRIVPRESHRKSDAPLRLGELSSQELVPLVAHPNGWHRDVASRLLYQRQDRRVVPALEKLVKESTFPQGRMTALHVLQGMASLREEMVLKGLADASPQVRIQALRLAEQHVAGSPAIRAALVAMHTDDDLEILYQLAFSLGAFRNNASSKALVSMAKQHVTNPWMRLAILSSLERRSDVVFQALVRDEGFRKTAAGRQFLVTLATQVSAAGRGSEIAVVVNTLQSLPEGEKSLGEALVQALITNQKGVTRERILAAAGGKASVILAELLAEARERAVDEKTGIAERADAIRSLQLGTFQEQASLLENLLQLKQPQPIQAAALEVVGEYSDVAAAGLVLEVWPGLSPGLRTRAAETLLSRPAWVSLFLDAIEEGKVARSDIDPSRVQLLLKHPQSEVVQRVQKLFDGTGLAGRADVVKSYQRALDLEGDAQRGKMVFKKNCSACHRLEDVGNAIGAELRGIRQRGLASVMLNVLDPNREVKPKYLTYVLETTAGKVLTGMIAVESANSVTIRRVDGTSESVQRVQIDQLRSTGLSFMPEGLEKQINVEAMADLLSYLDSID